ncbi:AHH domain-containing protein [Paenibacillus sp. FSL H7-0357]|uniref:AHH domain-containing protein n=1 Tax=Paenibacillus sp. FSL H7-0357 TaxID=1536774 RepID=UPI00068B4456|nr:AHH domain-containing protein [Paenibacillus sp. FSL H7-0357]
MGIVEAATGTWNLKCHSPYPVHSIQNIHMERKAGGHARLFLTAVLPEEQQDREIDMTANGENISLIETGERGQEIRKLFQGIIQEVGVRDVQGVYILELEAVSYSYLLDIEPRIRSFQHSEMECEDVIRQVLSAYPKSDLIDYVSSGTKLGGLTVQYRETDWQFLRRIASRFGAVVIPEVTADAPKLYFGVPDGGYHELKDQNYTVTRDLHALKMSWSVGAADVREADFTSYRVETRRWFGLGDTVQFQGQELRVAAAESRLMQGMLIHTYTLSPHSGIRENEIRNDELAGASLEGKILAVTKDTVKVHLDVDATQAEHEASWMPYSAVYASDGGGFYCMPQAGDSVQVYFGSGREQDAFAMGSVRRGSSPSPKTADPATKSWGTNFGKEMRMTDAEMSLIATEGSLFITLDDGGISITSNSGIQIKTVQDLVLDSEKSIEIEAKEILFLQSGDSSLVLDGMSDLRGSSLTMNGIIKLPVQVEDLEPQYEAPFVSEVAVPEEPAPEEQPKKKKKGFWSKVLDVSQTVLDVAGLIPGVGEIADLANAGIYALRGDYTSALLSVGASVPFAGWGATGAKLLMKSEKFMKVANVVGKATKAVNKVADKGADVARAIGKIADNAGEALNAGLGKVLTKAKKLASNVSTFDLAGKLKSGMNTILTNSAKLKKALHKNVSALDEMWTGWKQQVKHEVKKTADQVMDQVSDTMTRLKNRLSGPQKALDGPSNVSFSKPDNPLPQNSQQKKFWSEMEAGKDDLAKKMPGGTGDSRRIPGTPGYTTKGDPTELGQNMLESMGLPRSTSWSGYQAQHIIPSQVNNHPVIKKVGMDMNHASNGIFLPEPSEFISGLSRHKGYHKVYNDVVRNQLDKMDVNQSVEILEKQVFNLQQKLKKAVEKGLPLYKSKVKAMGLSKFYRSGENKRLPIWNRGGGATEELWERWLNR